MKKIIVGSLVSTVAFIAMSCSAFAEEATKSAETGFINQLLLLVVLLKVKKKVLKKLLLS